MSFPKTPALVTDCAVFDPEGRVLLVQRGSEPFKGFYALPGGFVDIGVRVEDACRRETHEEAGVFVGQNLHLIGVYSDPNRDPRGHSVSVACEGLKLYTFGDVSHALSQTSQIRQFSESKNAPRQGL